MSMNEDRHTDRGDGDRTAQPAEEKVERRPYQAPRILSRVRRESIAGFRGKATADVCGTLGPANS